MGSKGYRRIEPSCKDTSQTEADYSAKASGNDSEPRYLTATDCLTFREEQCGAPTLKPGLERKIYVS